MINCGYFNAELLEEFTSFSTSTTAAGLSGIEENFNNIATNKNANPKTK
jgi:hypothetical protein